MLAALTGASYWVLTHVHGAALEDAAAVPTSAEEPPAEADPPSTPDVGLQIEYGTRAYTVSGTTPDEVLAALRERGPRSGDEWFFGLTETSMDLTYRVADLEGGCGVLDARLDLGVLVTLPEWTPTVDTDRTLVRDWGRFFRALSRHEARHREIAEDGARDLFRQLDGLRRPDCTALEAELGHRLSAAQRDIEGAHRDYDARTGHGRTEGAVWPARRTASVEPREVRGPLLEERREGLLGLRRPQPLDE